MATVNDAEYEFHKNRIKKVFDRWFKPLGLGHWQDINIAWCREPKPSNNRGDDDAVAADCNVSWEYLQATIKFYVLEFIHMEDDRLEYCVVHELMHIFVNELREEGMKHEERVCTQLAQAFMWIRERGEEDGKEAAFETMKEMNVPTE